MYVYTYFYIYRLVYLLMYILACVGIDKGSRIINNKGDSGYTYFDNDNSGNSDGESI
jgi:hypothetical protein